TLGDLRRSIKIAGTKNKIRAVAIEMKAPVPLRPDRAVRVAWIAEPVTSLTRILPIRRRTAQRVSTVTNLDALLGYELLREVGEHLRSYTYRESG
ncbi:hypothetical protein AVEN_64918-1, partial [Araneus ventricosus]